MTDWKLRFSAFLLLAANLVVPFAWADGDTFAPGYDLIRDDGTDENRRGALNFIGTGVSCADDSANNETECTVSSGGTPGGSDPQVQFNDGGSFGGDAGFTYNKTSDVATLAGGLTLGADDFITLGTDTLEFDGTTNDFELSDDLTITDTTPHLRLTDSDGSQDDYELSLSNNESVFARTDGAVTTDLLIFNSSNQLRLPQIASGATQCLQASSVGVITGTGSACGSASGNSFETVDVPAGTDPVADSSTDTLTITETSFLTITGTVGTDTIDITQVTTDLGTDGLIAANAVALGTDTTNNYVATIADAGNSNITVANSGTESAAVTLDVVDVTCTDCLGTTEIADSYVLNAGDTVTGTLTLSGTPPLTLTAEAAPTTDADGEIALDTDGWGTNFDALEVFNGTASAYLVATTASDTPSNGQVPKFNTGGSITWEADADSGGATAWDAITDPSVGADIAFAETAQTISGNTNNVTSIAQDLLTLNYTNDGATDILTQQVLVLNNVDSTGSTTTETLLLLKNSDTDEAVTDGIFFDAAAGAITTGINLSDAEIGDALLVGANPIAFGNVAGTIGDSTTDSITFITDGTGTAEMVLRAGSVDSTEILDATVAAGDLAQGVLPDREFPWSAESTMPSEPADSIAVLAKSAGTNHDVWSALHADAADNCRAVRFTVPPDVDTAGTVTFGVYWFASTATTGDAVWDFREADVAEGTTWDTAVSTETSAADTTQGTVNQVTLTTWTETTSNLTWAAGDLVLGRFCRDGDHASDSMTDTAKALHYFVRVPRS